jgi:hypothetical protein
MNKLYTDVSHATPGKTKEYFERVPRACTDNLYHLAHREGGAALSSIVHHSRNIPLLQHIRTSIGVLVAHGTIDAIPIGQGAK